MPGGGGTRALLAFVRAAGDERVLVAHNLSTLPLSTPLSLDSTAAEPLWADAGAVAGPAGATSWRITLPPRGSGVWRLSG